MSYFDYDFAGLAIECGSHSDYVECQFSHALTPIRKVPPSATSGRLVTITPLTTRFLIPAPEKFSEADMQFDQVTEEEIGSVSDAWVTSAPAHLQPTDSGAPKTVFSTEGLKGN